MVSINADLMPTSATSGCDEAAAPCMATRGERRELNGAISTDAGTGTTHYVLEECVQWRWRDGGTDGRGGATEG